MVKSASLSLLLNFIPGVCPFLVYGVMCCKRFERLVSTPSLSTHTGVSSSPVPDPASIDLTGINDLDFFLTVAKEVGLFVIVRPGPYINAETTMGGMAPWTVNIDATLRTNDSAWEDAWKPYIEAISKVVVKHQLTFDAAKSDDLQGGSVILVQADNEYKTGPAERAYMKKLVSTFKKSGISVPITYNDPGRESNFVDLVDLYGLDSYPQRFDCSHPETWVPFRDDYLQYHMQTNPDQPFYIPEFQGGSYDPYGGPGYEACGRMTNASFTRVANQALIAQRVTLLSLYMVYGGTNWGGLAEPDVYTSYDYGAALDEHRQTTEKYAELKRQGLFVRAFPDLAMTEQIVDKTGYNISQVSHLDSDDKVNSKVFRTTVLENPETKSKFYVVRFDNTTESRRIRFAIEVESMGETVLLGAKREEPIERQIGVNFLNGRDSHIIPVDQHLPGGIMLRYSTANVYRVATNANFVVITFDLSPGQSFEYGFHVTSPKNCLTGMRAFSGSAASPKPGREDGRVWEQFKAMHSNIQADAKSAKGVMPAFAQGDTHSRYVIYTTAEGTWIVIEFTTTSATRMSFSVPAKYHGAALAPRTSLQKERRSTNVVNRFFGESHDSVLLQNVDLLRNATYSSTDAPLDTLHLFGSLSRQNTTAWLMALPTLKHIYWNGQRVESRKSEDTPFFYVLSLQGVSEEVLQWNPPSLSDVEWRWADALPSATAKFDDSTWAKANKTTSFNPYTRDPSIDTQGTILFASEYAFMPTILFGVVAFPFLPPPSPMEKPKRRRRRFLGMC